MLPLICGSMAYDNIMVFPGRFSEQIMPEQIHILNVAFLVPELRREFGGCAGNIAYNLKLLGAEPLIMATVGDDFDVYEKRLDELGISREHVTRVPDSLTAQAYITTDMDDNQITAFHPGAMNHCHLNRITGDLGIGMAMISPDGQQGMVEHAEQLAEADIPFMFDPGQMMPVFGADELRRFIELARWIAVNDYEGRMLAERTGMSEADIAARVDALIVTRGSKGSRIFTGGETLEIPAAQIKRAVDPTGCGDAYRAGLIYGIQRGWSWADTGRLAALLGARKIEHKGTQNHHFTPGSLAHDFQAEFGYSARF